MHWTYQTEVGSFLIKPDETGRFTLRIDDELLGSYFSPQQAADDVCCCETGYMPWDERDPLMGSSSLSDFELHA